MPRISEEKLRKIRTIEFAINKHLFLICAAITLIVMLMAIIEFFSRGTFPPSKIGFFYVGVLFIYSVHKEMLRWLEEKKIERQGEYFLYSWIGLTAILYIINFLTKDYFNYSPEGVPLETLKEVSVITLQVAGIFLFTRLSKVIKIILEKK
ncbi:MAG: hypothetical protein E3J36_02125 [Candidatus Nealsonbacteria bacterium]|nr:MAG: hypothetical protein E3J36_02125 [Candidatus Nealsonbacteria bacterium]